MKVAIFGTGEVGKALARGFLAEGQQVMLGSREPAKLTEWATEAGTGASVGTSEEAAKFADVAVVATAWPGTENALSLAGPANLAGKVVIDVTNPLVYVPERPPELAIGHTDSGGEQVQRWLPGARVVKTFNTVGYGQFYKPAFPDGPPDMFICGNDAEAKKTVTGILKSFGWPAIDIGGIEGARLLEPLCILWVTYAMQNRSRDHAFKLLRK